MAEEIEIDIAQIQQWIAGKTNVIEIEKYLQSKGLAEETRNNYLKEYKRQRTVRRQTRGFVLAALGAFLGFVSCLLTVLNPIPALYNAVLFGVTSIAILLIVAGLYFLFEN